MIAACLRAVRDDRRLTAAEVAKRMEMRLRAYQYFEAGERNVDLPHLKRFATATRCDLFGLIAGIYMGRPDFAVEVADNKLTTTFMILQREFHLAFPGEISSLGGISLIQRITEMFGMLAKDLKGRDRSAAEWLAAHSASVGAPVDPDPDSDPDP